MSFWSGRKVLVTGGASFIGSHLTEVLVHQGAQVRVADDFSSGYRENLSPVKDAIELLEGDLNILEVALSASRDREIVFHLAADHGGRGYVDLHQYACARNLGLDQTVISAAIKSGVEKIVFASSGCVYPNHIQTDPGEEVFLTEDLVGPPYDPDGMYGMAKLAGELTLRALAKETKFASASCRYFTVYGPRGLENHAVMAMIARAFLREDPFVVWGTGEQIRNWTYVEDIVSGTILAGERLDDGSAVNLGTMERVRVLDAVHMIAEKAGYQPSITTLPEMPTGPMNRVADNSRARDLLGWAPKVKFVDGVTMTMDWYFATKDLEEVRQTLGVMLTERPTALATGQR